MLALNAMFTFVVVNWLSFHFNWSNNIAASSSPKFCLQQCTLNALINCLDVFTVPPDFYNESTYAAAQPRDEENAAWMSVITAMLNTNTADCTDVALPSPLKNIYAVTLFTDLDTKKAFCVFSETTALSNNTFAKGWGTMVVPASTKDISRHIHLSAPHPQADMHTPQQAGAMFTLSGAHSLLISGRFRSAYSSPTNCTLSVNSKTVFYKTDPAHDVDEPFHSANRIIREWQNANGGCPSETCAYVQIHGKAASTCRESTIFVSSGLGTSESSLAWYRNRTLDIPARRLRDEAKVLFPTWNVSLPSDDSSCGLTATTNVFGRLLNGVAHASVCTTEATSGGATGEFIHIEQAIVSRVSDAYEQWGEVLRRTFRTECAEGMVEDYARGLCI
ncbi:hypothetical protein BDP27DRAFT_1415323 [Rhodocollybia butyracea]|uniref:Uncharacterized protein n=1 Tax=Rhodocollybia butyracea TaxID=206335 RepID=A0A9P5PZL3_9AGAR|nr:hypothetical protein BDP27DRAFT_1415323 [Rhodocollybia butyracea]